MPYCSLAAKSLPARQLTHVSRRISIGFALSSAPPCSAKFKFPGRQLIITSKKHGFTKWGREEFKELCDKGLIIPDGFYAKLINNKGSISEWAKNVQRAANA